MAKKQSLKDKIRQRRQEIKDRSAKGNMIFLKADQTLRVRILNVGEEEEFIQEVTHFYLGSEIKGVISPATFDEPCAILEAYDELKHSDDPDDKELAKQFPPRSKYLALVMVYKDQRGKEIDEDNSGKLIQLTQGLYEEITDLFLDEDDEWGDPTDLQDGYDLKLKRTGSGKTDTEYTVTPCPKNGKKLPAKYAKVHDIQAVIREAIPSYEQTEQYIQQFLGVASDEEEEEKPRKKKTSTRKKSPKNRKSDL